MKRLIFTFSVAGGLLISMAYCSKKNDNNTVAPIDTTSTVTVKYIDTSANAAFVHPGLLHGKEDFDRMKIKVNAGAEPWISGWNKMIANSHARASYIANPTVKLIRGGGTVEEPEPDNYSRAFNDVAAAYQLAVRWKITGDDVYAQAAVNILNAWASTCIGLFGDSNQMLAAGIYGYQFANAAEILRDYSGWAAADFTKFKTFMLTVFYPKNHDFLVRHNGTCISHYWANWDLCNIASVMAIGVLTDNRQLYNEAVNYFQRGAGNGNILKAINYIHPNGLGQVQESGRDQGHATLCISLLGTICQMALHQGDDFFAFDNNRLLKACEYTAKYNVANLDVPFSSYTNCDNITHTVVSPDSRGTVRPMWAIVYNYYAKRKGLPAPYTLLGVNTTQPEGGGGDYGPNSGGFDQLGFGTLLYSLE